MNTLAPSLDTPAKTTPASFDKAPLGLLAWIAALLLALAAFGLYSRDAKFPYFDHVDEPNKVHQVQTLERNFHHPLLLLNTTYAALKLGGGSFQSQAVVEMGRKVSAAAAAISVAALALLAWRLGGPVAGVLGGLVTLSHPLLFELSHYMKEDCVLLAGLTTTLVLLNRYNEAPSSKLAALAGVAAGFAVAGKYVGFFMLVLGWITILRTPSKGKWNAALWFGLIALGVFALVNLEILLDLESAAWGLGTEFTKMQAAAEDHSGFFHHKYLSCLTSYVSAPLLVGVVFWAARRWKQRTSQRLFTWVLLGFPIVLILAMSFSPKVKDRYVLPAALILGILGSAGLVEMARTARFRHARTVAAFLAAVALAWPIPAVWRCHAGLQQDDRLDLIAWMRENLPPEARIACDGRTRLEYAKKEPETDLWFPQEIRIAERSAADLGTLDELRAQGIHYAAVSEQAYGGYIRSPKGKKPNALRLSRETFYKQLFSTGRLLWQSPRGQIAYLHPGLRLYEF